MNQDKLEVVKQEMARENIDIFGISELKWTGMGEFNSDDHYIYYCGQESLRRNGVAIISSVTHSCLTLCNPHGLQHSRSPCPSPTPGAYSNSCPSHWWCHPTITSSVIPFSSHLQSFPASGAFQVNQLFASSGQSIGVSTSMSVLPMNIQDWFPLGWTHWISLQSKGLSRVFSNTTVQKHQFFGAQLSL